MTYTLYHNPKCSKSRASFELLKNKNINFIVREYLKEPLSFEEIETLLKKLSLSPIELIRAKEKILIELNINIKQKSDLELIQLMIDHPILIERPILETDQKAIIGRPPENILKII